jgi:hypothetical protein
MDEPVDIDLTTLAEVQRLLAETDFASIDDLVGRLAPSVAPSVASSIASSGDADRGPAAEVGPAAAFDGAGSAPLPRRR